MRRILLLTLAAVVLLSIVGGWLVWQRGDRFNSTVSSAHSISELFMPLMGSERVNIAIYGYGGESHRGGRFLADSINILSIDPVSHTTTIIPIPRDLWVEGLQRMPDNGKINEAFAIGYQSAGIPGAARYTSEILSRITGLDLHRWLALDFAGFRTMVDAVGGVTVDNPRAFEYTWSVDRYESGIFDAGAFAEGEIALDGRAALSYARARYTSIPSEASDFARSIRQQRVLAALQERLGSGLGALGPGLALMDALQSKLKTNLSVVDLFLIADRLTPDRRVELAEDAILEATGSSDGQYILVVIGRKDGSDYGPLRRFLRDALAEPIPSADPEPSVAE